MSINDELTASVSTFSREQTSSKQIMTIAFKVESKDLLLEVPLNRNRNFLILHCNIIQENGMPIHIRKMFEVQKRRL